LSQTSSQDLEAITLYFDFALDLATKFYFLFFHEVKFLLVQTLFGNGSLVTRDELAQYLFEYPTNWVWLLCLYIKPFIGAPFMHFRMQMTAF